MKSKYYKLAVSLCVFCFMIVATVFGVMAASNLTSNVSTTISFVSENIFADINLRVTGAYDASGNKLVGIWNGSSWSNPNGVDYIQANIATANLGVVQTQADLATASLPALYFNTVELEDIVFEVYFTNYDTSAGLLVNFDSATSTEDASLTTYTTPWFTEGGASPAGGGAYPRKAFANEAIRQKACNLAIPD